jgi:hypothetical protein
MVCRSAANDMDRTKMAHQEGWFLSGHASDAHEIRVVFDGPPGRDMPTFVELEDHAGRAIQLGQWRERQDGYWELVIPLKHING